MLQHISVHGMSIAHVMHLCRNVVQITLSMLLISALVLEPQANAQYGSYAGSNKEDASADPHALGVPWSLLLREESGAEDGATLANHAKDGESSSALRG